MSTADTVDAIDMRDYIMPFFGSPGGLAELRDAYNLDETFPGDRKVTRRQFRVCNGHSECVGCLDKGSTWKGQLLSDFTFIYKDGSHDNGIAKTKCSCKDGANEFAWIE